MPMQQVEYEFPDPEKEKNLQEVEIPEQEPETPDVEVEGAVGRETIEKPSKQKLLELYQQADLFIFASISETQGLVLAEAMASGTPVIALDGPGQRDVIENGFNGYLVNNIGEMCQAIQQIVFNQELHNFLNRPK